MTTTTTFAKTSNALSNLLEKFKCNQCKQILKNACSFELCDHFFCKSCAIKLVNDSTPCPICEIVLWKEHMQEIHWIPEVLSTIENIDCIINNKPVTKPEENNRKRSSFTKVKGADKLDNIKKTNILKPENKESKAPARAARRSIITGKRKSRGEKPSVAGETCESKGVDEINKTISKRSEKERKIRPKGKVTERKNIRGETPLHVACVKGNIERVKELLECGAKVNTRDFAEWTPLHEACNHGYEEIVKLLITHGAYIDATAGEDKDTPLHDAVANNHIGVVRFLLQRDDAPLDLKNAQGQLPEDLCTTDEMRNLFE